MKIILTILGIQLCCVSSISASQIKEWSKCDGGNGHFYQAVYLADGISWIHSDAAAKSLKQGWHLVAITSAEENDFVVNLINDGHQWWTPSGGGNFEGPWIGGYRMDKKTQKYGWVTGEDFVYSDWGPFEPGNNGDRIVLFNFQGRSRATWNDAPAQRKQFGYIIETPNEIQKRQSCFEAEVEY